MKVCGAALARAVAPQLSECRGRAGSGQCAGTAGSTLAPVSIQPSAIIYLIDALLVFYLLVVGAIV